MSSSLFEVAVESGTVVILPEGLQALRAHHPHQRVNVFLLAYHAPASSKEKDAKEIIEFELISDPSSECCCIIIDVTAVFCCQTAVSLLANLFTISSALFVELSVENSLKNVEHMSILNTILGQFDGDIATMLQSVKVPLVQHFISDSNVSLKERKKSIEKYLQLEKGFTELISYRNCTRNILQSIRVNREVLSLSSSQSACTFPIDCSITSSTAKFASSEVQSVYLTMSLLEKFLNSFSSNTILSVDSISLLMKCQISEIEDSCLLSFKERTGIEDLDKVASNLNPDKVYRLKAETLDSHCHHFFVVSHESRSSRKRLEDKMRSMINNYKSCRLKLVEKESQKKISDLSHILRDIQLGVTGSDSLNLKLGESGDAYSFFLGIKAAFEKAFNAYSSEDISSILPHSTENDSDVADVISGIRLFNQVEEMHVELIWHHALYSFCLEQFSCILQLGRTWLSSFEMMKISVEEKKTRLRVECTKAQDELEQLVRNAVREKEEAGERIVALMDAFEMSREEQAKALESKQLELDRLVAGLDRTTRLNETDKEDLTNELMKIQQKIEEAQNRALELRQERENQTSVLHNDLLEEERKGHQWFRTAFNKQHALLSEELSLERQVNLTKSQQMEQIFSIDSQHMRNLEKIRMSAQEKKQMFRDEMFRQREKRSHEHEKNISRLRLRNLELESKLRAAKNDNSQQEESEKNCAIM